MYLYIVTVFVLFCHMIKIVYECPCMQISQVLGSGKALQRNPVLRKSTESVFGLPLVILDGVDAPKGAAVALENLR